MSELEDLEIRIEEIDKAIVTHNKVVRKLSMQRYKLIAQKPDLEMTEAFECAIENDISPRRVVDLIVTETEKRNARLGA